MLAHRRYDLLQIGAAGRLMITGELWDVLPLEDADAFEKANPVQSDGTVRFSKKETEAREDAMVRRLLAGLSPSVVVLGAAHDLTEKVAGRALIERVEPEALRSLVKR